MIKKSRARTIEEIRAFYRNQAALYKPDGVIKDVLFLLEVIDRQRERIETMERIAIEDVRAQLKEDRKKCLRKYPE
jgi:hypothetical protein